MKILLLLLFPLSLCAQHVNVEKDKFTGERRLSTETAMMYYSFSKPGIKVKFRATDTTCFMGIYGFNLIGVVNGDDYLMFLLDNGKTVRVYSTGMQSYTISSGNYGSVNKEFNYQYALSQSDLQLLAANPATSIRTTYENKYHDIELKEKQGKNIMEYAAAFLNELNKK